MKEDLNLFVEMITTVVLTREPKNNLERATIYAQKCMQNVS